MSQFIIVNKLAKFIQHSNSKLGISMVIAGGYCQGLSVCYAVMKKTGKQAWWQAALHAVVSWDLTKSSLDEEISLPQQEQLHTLREIFTRVLNYVVFHQSSSSILEKNFLITDQNQSSLLSEGGEFELLGVDKTIKKIQSSRSLSACMQLRISGVVR